MRSCIASRTLAFLILFHVHTVPALKAGESDEKAVPIYFPVCLEGEGEPIRFAATAASFDLQVLSSSPMSPARPLLIIINPGSYSMPELHRRVTALVAALAAELPKQAPPRIRVGIPALDGILFDLPAGSGTSSDDIVSAIMRLIPDTESEQGNDPGRALDFAAVLLQKAEADSGPVDCILVGKDRPFEGDDGGYVRLSAERRILEVCRRKGSVVHGYLGGMGEMGPVCAATGGILFGGDEQPGAVIRRVLAARRHSYLLAVQKKAAGTDSGRFVLAIRAEDRAGNRLNLRTPAAIWRNPDDSPAPEYESVREALEWVGRAQRAAERGEVDTAVRFIQNAVQMDPCNPDVLYFSAKYAAEAGELPLAESHVSKAMRFVPQTERVLILYGEVFRKLGRSAEALETLKSLPPGIVPASNPFRLTVARLLSSVGRNEEAASLYADLTAPGKDTSQAHAEYGCLLWRMGKAGAAAEQIRSALSADQQNVTAMLCSADMTSAEGRLEEALEAGSRAAALRPEDPDVRMQIAKIHARAQQWESALASLQEAVNFAPARTDILVQLAEAELHAGRGREAVETINKVLSLNPLDPGISQQVAGLLVRAGAFVNAATVLEESAARMPEKAQAQYREAAELRERIEQYGQALLDYRALQAAASGPAAKPERDLSSHLAYLSVMVSGTLTHLGGRSAGSGGASLLGGGPGIVVPGGLSALAGMTGLRPATLKDSGAAGRVLSVILDSLPSSARSPRANLSPLQSEIVGYFQNYERLLTYMANNRLLPVPYDRSKQIEIVFPLVGSMKAVEQTATLLRFFGVKYSSSQKGGKSTVTLSMNQDATSQQRQRFLRWMGNDIESKNLRELRLRLGDEILPSIIKEHAIRETILGLRPSNSQPLLAILAQRPDALNLYLALENCPTPLRDALLLTLGDKDLMPLTQILARFGRFLEFREGRLVLPGSEQAWEKLAGASHSDPKAFIRAFVAHGKGRLLFTYFTLNFSSPAVQQYFTASSERLDELSNALAPVVSGRITWQPDLDRLVRTLSADNQGLFLPLDGRFGAYLFPDRPKAGQSPSKPDFAPLRITLKEVARLAQSGGKPNPVAALAGNAGFIEFLEFLQAARPEVITGAVVEAVMRNPAESPGYVNLIWDLDPPPDLLVPYLAYCRELAQSGDRGWNVKRTRTSQSIFFLISALCREKVIDLERGRELLKTALADFSAENETAFLLSVSEFLNSVLLPELGHSLRLPADSPDLLEQALAGPTGQQVFLFGGAPIIQDNHSEQLQRIKSVIRLQHLALLPELLEAIQLTHKLQLCRDPHFDWLKILANRISKLPGATPVMTPSSIKDKEQASPRSPFEDLVRTLEELSVPTDSGRHQEKTREALKQASAVLHAELGLALLGHCYAYYATPQTAALSYDPDLVRKHDFYPQTRSSSPAGKGTPDPQRGKEARGVVMGSLSGLAMQLHRLETAASAQSFGKENWSGVVPAVLSGIRMTPQALRTERAQEYVALSVRLGREILATCFSTPGPAEWCDLQLAVFISPLRSEKMTDLRNPGDVAGAIDLFSPSELFFLGEAYLLAVEALPSRACGRLTPFGCGPNAPTKLPEVASPSLQRLQEIIPSEKSPEFDSFLREVGQYGCSACRRLGVTENSLRFCAPYEQLQNLISPGLLFDRMIDVKIRVAESSYATGVPASLGGMMGELALQNLIADPASARAETWNDVMEEIARLGPGHVGGWMEELLNRGSVTSYPGKPAEKQEEFQ